MKQLIAAMQQAGQPNPQAQQMAMAAQQAQLQFQQSQTNAFNGQAAESQAGLLRSKLKLSLLPQELEIDVLTLLQETLKKATKTTKSLNVD